MKLCSRCGEEKPASDYASHKETRDKLQPWCRPCFAVYRKAYKNNNREKVKAGAQAWIEANRERVNAGARRRRRANPEAVREVNRKRMGKIVQWASENRERVNATLARWKKRNRHIVTMDQRRRKAAKLCAIPAWADTDAIKGIYKVARDYGMSVDHVVPLRSKLVCGLHCEDNLRVISFSANAKKNNRHWPDMP